MARARNLKPGFFKNEDLAECCAWSRLCFAGLWTLADREGRLEDRPKRIKGELFAFDSIDVEPLLAQLQKHGFIVRYEVEGRGLIQVVAFLKHQNPHHREPISDLPPPQSPGLYADAMAPKPEALGALDEPKARGQPEALGSRSDLARGSSRAESGALNPDTGKETCAPSALERRFVDFWKAYPAKVGKDAARKAFERRSPDAELLGQMLAAIEAQKASERWKKDGGQFIPNPATWLNQGRWMDEETKGPGELHDMFRRGAA